MKKTLIAAAVAAAVAAPAANAGVTIYGQIHASIDYQDFETSGRVVDGGVFGVNNRTSRLGFKGSEELGNGLKAIWKVVNTLRITDTSNTPNRWSHNGAAGHWGSARNAYIGLAGDWGTFLYGRHDTPYKMAFYASGIDMLGDSFMDVNAMYSITEVRADDAIAYVSPNWNGLTFAAAIVPGEGYTDASGSVYDGIADNYSIGVMYSNNGIKLSAGYESLDQGLSATTGIADLCVDGGCENMMVGAGWSGNNFDISAVWVNQDYGSYVDYDAYVLAMAYTMGNNKLIANIGQGDDGVDDGLGYGVALQHMFSKRTSAYLGYSNSEASVYSINGSEAEQVSFGMIHKF
jgi:predicted porin